jgi:DHA2 family multidrug resistance protein-like MFS transporter
VEVAGALGGAQGHALLTAAQDAFVNGLRAAAGVGAAVLLATAVGVWFLLGSRRRPAPGR